MTDGKAQRPEGSAQREARSEHIPTPEGRGGEDKISAIAMERADWLLDAIACSLQDRRFLRGDKEYDAAIGRAILLNADKAIQVAISRALLSSPRVERERKMREEFSTVWDRVTGASTPTMIALRKKLSAHDLRMLLLVALDMPVIEHEWFRPDGRPYDCCRNCGIVRRRDGLNSACKGHVKVALRSLSTG